MSLGLIFMLVTFPRLTSVASNEGSYYGAKRYKRREDGELPVVIMKQPKSEE